MLYLICFKTSINVDTQSVSISIGKYGITSSSDSCASNNNLQQNTVDTLEMVPFLLLVAPKVSKQVTKLNPIDCNRIAHKPNTPTDTYGPF